MQHVLLCGVARPVLTDWALRRVPVTHGRHGTCCPRDGETRLMLARTQGEGLLPAGARSVHGVRPGSIAFQSVLSPPVRVIPRR
jgi:hypothetical protein